MKIKGLSIERDVDLNQVDLHAFAFALITEMSRVRLLSGEEAAGYVIGDELLEARFFDAEKELHIWREDGNLCAVLVKETGKTNPVRKKFPVTGSVSAAAAELETAQYVTFDADGQACIGLTRLCGVKRMEE